MKMKNLWKLQVFLAVVMVLMLFPAVLEYQRYTTAREDAYLASIELVSKGEISRLTGEVRIEMEAPVADIGQYFITLEKVSNLERLQRKFIDAISLAELRDVIGVANNGNRQMIMQMQDRYRKHYGTEAFAAEADKQNRERPSRWFSRPEVPNQIAEITMTSYLYSVIVAVMFFCVSLTRKKMIVVLEIHKVLVAAMFWPIAVWKYPQDMKPLEQLKKVLRLVSYFLTAVVSVGGAGIAKAATGEKENEKGEEAQATTTLVVDAKPIVTFATGYKDQKVNDTGLIAHKGPVTWADVAVTFNNGVTVDLWGSRRISGSSSSDELDLTVSKSFALKSASLTTGLAYYDIAPVTGKGADFISPFASFEQKFGGGMRVFARAGGLLLSRNESGKNGYSVRAGAGISKRFGPVSSDIAVSVVRYAGPFGTAKSTSTRFDASASIPVASGLTAFLSLKSFAPWKGNERPKATEIGAGLAFGF